MTALTRAELQRGRIKIARDWPLDERASLTRMTEPEVRLIVLATALLDLTPVEAEWEPSRDELLIDLR